MRSTLTTRAGGSWRSTLTTRALLGISITLVAAACSGGSGATTALTVAPASNGPTAATSAAAGTPDANATPTPTPFAAQSGSLTLVAYSTPKSAYDAIIPLWQATADGSGVEVETSFGASGDQSRAVDAGLPADVVAFSLAPDVDRLVQSGKIDASWNTTPTKGMVTDSVVVFVVRKGNPKNIKTWDDLIQPGVGVIEANPFTSGGARWNVMAAYGAWKNAGLTDEQAEQNLQKLFENVLVQDTSARASLQTFISGQGDVMLAYENEAIAAQQGGQDIDYVVPDSTILIENPVAVTKVGDTPDKAASFVSFLTTPEAQNAFAGKGYRPVIAGVTPPEGIAFPTPSSLFTIDDLGGWTQVNTKFFDKTSGIVAKIEQGLGVQP